MNHPKDKFDAVRRNPYSITYVRICIRVYTSSIYYIYTVHIYSVPIHSVYILYETWPVKILYHFG